MAITRRSALAYLVLILLAGALLRLPDLSTIPPGVHFDEAANGILAGEMGRDGNFPLFITSYTGKEVLFFYAAGGLMRLLGHTVFALRLTSAYLGLLTVAATYWLGREFGLSRRSALLATALIAVSFWHLQFSRLGFRAIAQPLFQASAVAAFYRGYRRKNWGWALVGGCLLGLTAYTYLAARLFPFLLAIGLLPLLFQRERPARRRAWGLSAIYLLTTLLVAVPLLSFFVSRPEAFWVRISQVGPQASATSDLIFAYVRSLQMLFLNGDPYWRFNIPNRPIFELVTGLFLILGGLVVLRRTWRGPAMPRSTGLLLLLAPLIMILPTALAVDEILPSNLRAIGLAPFIFYLPAIGLDAMILWGIRLLGNVRVVMPIARWATPFLLTMIIVSGGFATWKAYAQDWARRTDVYYETEADLAFVARYIDDLTPLPDAVFVASEHYRHPAIAFSSQNYSALRWLVGNEVLVLPTRWPSLVIFPHSAPAAEWMLPLLSEAEVTTGSLGPDNQPNFVAYRLAGTPELEYQTALGANFDNRVRLLGYTIDHDPESGQPGVTLTWRVEGQPGGAIQPFVHLEDRSGFRWAQRDLAAFPSEQWLPGDIIIQHLSVPVPSGTPPGSYQFRIGYFDPLSGQPLPLLDEEGRYAGDSMNIQDVIIQPTPLDRASPRPPVGIEKNLLPQLRLLGVDPGPGKIKSGEAYPLALYWQVEGRLPPLILRLELQNEAGISTVLSDGHPVQNTLPFESWPESAFIIDRQAPVIPDDRDPGSYRLIARVVDVAGNHLLAQEIAQLDVRPNERLFSAPDIQHHLGATFGGNIQLLGYDLVPVGDDQVELMLVWQAIRPPSDDYTTFVHLLSSDGTCCQWQQDRLAGEKTRPTSQWVAGEVIVDRFVIPLESVNPGNYSLEIGLYQAANGQRLRIDLPGNPLEDAIIIYDPLLQLSE